ncbi:MAG: hypothetical protein ABEJ28_04290 [Salinigranum sp.]
MTTAFLLQAPGALTLAQQLEQIAGLGIFVVAFALAILSFVAWRRERQRRMLVVSFAYAMFAVNGFLLFIEYALLSFGIVPFAQVDLVEHGSSFLVLLGLLAFFAAIRGE